MKSTTRTARTGLAALALLAVAGCQGAGGATAGEPASPGPSLHVTGGMGTRASAAPLPEDHATRPAQGDVTAPTPAADNDDALKALFLLPHPSGPKEAIALRFLRALQGGDHLAAAAELSIVGRTYFATEDGATLRTVLDDVAGHARLASAGPCTSARSIDATSTVVTCGSQAVVVHVFADEYGSGVQLSDRHPAHDRFEGPHTHAFTSLGP